MRREILRLAAIGLFWSDLFGCPEYPDALRTRIADALEQLALDWSHELNHQQSQEA